MVTTLLIIIGFYLLLDGASFLLDSSLKNQCDIERRYREAEEFYRR